MPISVVINTYNAEKHLKNVLEAAKGLDEILICDMYSDDATISIAENYGCKIILHDKLGFVEPARNFAIQNAKYDWVLLLDADEVISEDLKKFIKKFQNNSENKTCLAIPRKNYFLGKFMRSAYPDYVYRFFRKDAVHWPEFIHSVPIIKGKIEKINPKRKNLAIEHLANESVAMVLDKNNKYAAAEIPKRKGKKIAQSTLILSPFFWFFKYYILKKGFLDGKEGLIFAMLKSQYKFATLAKIFENQLNDQSRI